MLRLLRASPSLEGHMTSITLSGKEKAQLTDLARRMVHRAAAAGETPAGEAREPAPTDGFSEEARAARLSDMERKISELGKTWSDTLNTILFTVERLESRIGRLEGEVAQLQGSNEEMAKRIAGSRSDLEDAAVTLGAQIEERLQGLLDRADAVAGNVAKPVG